MRASDAGAFWFIGFLKHSGKEVVKTGSSPYPTEAALLLARFMKALAQEGWAKEAAARLVAERRAVEEAEAAAAAAAAAATSQEKKRGRREKLGDIPQDAVMRCVRTVEGRTVLGCDWESDELCYIQDVREQSGGADGPMLVKQPQCSCGRAGSGVPRGARKAVVLTADGFELVEKSTQDPRFAGKKTLTEIKKAKKEREAAEPAKWKREEKGEAQAKAEAAAKAAPKAAAAPKRPRKPRLQ